ncbi:hypothetical protein CCYA_CCYA07G2154 [Cyanidiococcus yangmingshanensis]|nr:hypothetical protein CCYA_CCYA07G2154 [Cyanidiococcus yangmingshanensis]
MNVSAETFALWESLDAVFELEQRTCDELKKRTARAKNSENETSVASASHESSTLQDYDCLGDKSSAAISGVLSFSARLDAIDRQLETARRTALEQVRADLEADLDRTYEVLDRVHKFVGILEEMEACCEQAGRDLSLFRAACEDAYAERGLLRQKVQRARERMELWAELNRLSERLNEVEIEAVQKGTLDSDLDGDSLLDIATGLEVCRERLLNAHSLPHSNESVLATKKEEGPYAIEKSKLETLQRRTRMLLRGHITALLQRHTAAIATELSRMSPDQRRGQTPDREDAVTSLRFRRIAGEIQRYAEAVYASMSLESPEAARFLSECEALFVEQRRQLVFPLAQEQIRSLAQDGELEQAARSAANMLIRVCCMELQLFQLALFPSNEAARDFLVRLSLDTSGQHSSPLRQWLESLARLILVHVLPRVLQESDLGALVRCIDTLQMDIMGGELPRLQPSLLATLFTEPISSLLADARERTIYRAQLFIRDRVLRFQPTDLDLEISFSQFHLESAQESEAEAGRSHAGSSAGQGNGLTTAPVYPATFHALQVLSQLHGRVDAQVFGGLAREAVEACIRNLQSAVKRHVATEATRPRPSGERISSASVNSYVELALPQTGTPPLRAQNSPLSSPRWDQTIAASECAEFFYLKQLLILHEHLGLFGSLHFVDHERQLKTLSFEEFRNGISGIVRGQISLRRLFGSVRDLIPKRVDLNSEELLQEELRFAYEAVVFRALRELLEPLLVFLSEVASKKNLGSVKEHQGSFANVDQVRQAWVAVQFQFGRNVTNQATDTIRIPLKRILGSWRRFFGERASQVLIETLRENAQETLNEFVSVLHRNYSVQERHTIGVDAECVRSLMEALAP